MHLEQVFTLSNATVLALLMACGNSSCCSCCMIEKASCVVMLDKDRLSGPNADKIESTRR